MECHHSQPSMQVLSDGRKQQQSCCEKLNFKNSGLFKVSAYFQDKIVLLQHFFLDKPRHGALNTEGLIQKYYGQYGPNVCCWLTVSVWGASEFSWGTAKS